MHTDERLQSCCLLLPKKRVPSLQDWDEAEKKKRKVIKFDMTILYGPRYYFMWTGGFSSCIIDPMVLQGVKWCGGKGGKSSMHS